MVSIPRASDVALKYTLNDTAVNLLYLPVAPQLRGKMKAVVDGMVKPVVLIGLGLTFLVVSKLGGPSVAQWSLLVLLLVAIWIALVFRASRHYVGALSQSIRQRRLDLDDTVLDLSDETTAGAVRQRPLGDRAAVAGS